MPCVCTAVVWLFPGDISDPCALHSAPAPPRSWLVQGHQGRVMSQQGDFSAEALFDAAAALCDEELSRLTLERPELGLALPLAMLEAAANAAALEGGHRDVARILRDLADQIEADAAEADEG